MLVMPVGGEATPDTAYAIWKLIATMAFVLINGFFVAAEFAFVKLPPEYTTGSSIMPNKKNPDVVELLRASPSPVLGAMAEVESLLSLPSGYHRDLQAFIEYRTASRTAAGYDQWRARWIDGVPDRKAYISRIGKDRLEALALTHHLVSAPADFGY